MVCHEKEAHEIDPGADLTVFRSSESRQRRPRFGFNLMKNSEEDSPRFVDFQSRFSRQFYWLPVPMTAKRLCKLICVAVLPAAKPFAIAPAMLQQNDSSFRSANSRHPLKRSDRIWKRASRKRRDYRVKTVVRKRKSLRVGHQKRNIHG